MGTPTPKLDSLITEGENNQPTVDWEKRYKDANSFITKTRQELAAVKAENEVLKANSFSISAEQQAALDDLKFKDPDAWFVEMTKINSAKQTHINESVKVKQQELLNSFAADERAQALNDFNSLYKVELTPEILQSEIPARIHKELESGTLDYPAYLTKCMAYLNTNKVIGNGQQVMGQPNLGSAGGGSTPTDAANNEDLKTSYEKLIW